MKKVIIIEDSPTFCNMLGKKLEAKGWKTILCYNYRDGLQAVRESSEWDVVISDMRLGNDNGIDLLEWMRSNGYQNPFIIMTSYDESMSAVRTMKLGAAMEKYHIAVVEDEPLFAKQPIIMKLSPNVTDIGEMFPMDYEEFRWAMGDTASVPLLRHRAYNEQIQLVDDLEAAGKITCIRPIRPLEVGRIE